MLTELLEDALRPHLPPPPPLAPVVSVRGCHDCPMARSVSYSRSGQPRVDCFLAGTLPVPAGAADVPGGRAAPDGCPLRGGPVTLQLVERRA